MPKKMLFGSVVFAFVFIELTLLIVLGQLVGILGVWIFLITSALCGIFFSRKQNLLQIIKAKNLMQEGVMPFFETLEYMTVSIGGLLLIVPGIISDMMGVLLLIPSTRQKLLAMLRQKFAFSNASTQQGKTYEHQEDYNTATRSKNQLEDDKVP